MQQPKYKFYATLLDSYQWYLNSESDNALQEFIDKLNRVPFTSEAAAKGTAFNNLVDAMVQSGLQCGGEAVEYEGYEFKASIVNYFAEELQGATPQYFTKGLIQTSRGLVELYGYVDEIKADKIIDIKTTGSYTFPKYLNSFQRIVYPFCLYQQGMEINDFQYLITDFNSVYKEDYRFNMARDVVRLREVCESLIDFIEAKRDCITDKKLFAMDVPRYEPVFIVEPVKK